MKNLLIGFLVVASLCYMSSAFFVLTTSDQEVKNYCRQDVMDNESKFSQRNTVCKLRKYR